MPEILLANLPPLARRAAIRTYGRARGVPHLLYPGRVASLKNERPDGKMTMIGRSLNRRLEHLETRLHPVAGEPAVIIAGRDRGGDEDVTLVAGRGGFECLDGIKNTLNFGATNTLRRGL